MKADPSPKFWEKTRRNNLVRHKNGRYYARLYHNGKEIWKSLKTDHVSIAEARLAEMLKEHRVRKSTEVEPSDVKMTFGKAAALHLKRVADDVNLKRNTRKYWREIHTALLKSWPALATTELRRLTAPAFREWAARQAKQISATRFNGTLSFLRRVIAVAQESGIVFADPSSSLQRAAVRNKRPSLPSRAKFAEFLEELRNGHSRDSRNCADLAAGLAYTGCRLGEAKELLWADLDFEAGIIEVKGDPEEATKNSEVRTVEMMPAAKLLFERMRNDRPDERATERVFLVHECQGAMNRAVVAVGMKRITHHDLRHFFATICIESGVDIPTVSRWLGHKDGGGLAMRTYGHLRREHSAAQAQKVSFEPMTAASA